MIKIATYEFPVIYVYRINDAKHKDILKVGMTSIEAESADVLEADCETLRNKAKARINQQTGTASIDYDLLYTELAFFEEDGIKYHFADYDVREVLENSGYANACLTNNNGAVANEWVKVNDVEIVKKAITAVKERRSSLAPNDFKKAEAASPIVIKFREEQSKAINDTLARFAVGNKMLWNAKMRFGKTLCALEVIKRQQYRRTLIITHRPAVRDGWFEDFNLLGFGEDYFFGHKNVAMPKPSPDDSKEQKKINELIATKVKKFDILEKNAESGDMRYIYFASIQDLRGSWDKETGEYKKNREIFEADWDLLIVDEAHEGTKTELGKSVIAELQKHEKMRTLYLSGTPYNILDNFKTEEVYSWTYEMEQEAKQRWYDEHPDEPNPYEDLPRLELHTYNIDNVFDYERDEENDFFNFAEFFRVDKETDNFVHEKEIKAFLDLMCKDSADSNYPYSTEEYRFSLSHTLWVLPGVPEAAALSRMIKEHETLKQYYVINVAGEGDDDQDNSDSVKNVKDNIAAHDKTITLTCGRLTTGVSVPEWSAVFMLCGGSKISASFYLQTIFRAQTPTKRNVFPKKKVCYAFDFAPDRTIEVINEYVDQQRKTSRHQPPVPRESSIETTLRFMAIIAHEGSREKPYDTISFMKDIGKAYKEHIKRKGFRDRRLFVDLGHLTDEQYRAIGEIGLKMAKNGHTFSSGGSNSGLVQLADSGLDDNKPGKKPKGDGKKPTTKKPKSPKPSGSSKSVDKSQEAFKVLGDIYIRLPMLIFGCELKDENITLQRIIDEVDDASWEVFMPKGVGKAEMQALMQLGLFKEEPFAAAASDIPAEIQTADTLTVTERVKAIAEMIARFRFPDKETVLTPWRVVNMHLSDTIGGYDFYDENHNAEIAEPRLVCHEGVTEKIFKADAKVLEINSKSGLYPLYMAYSLYRKRISLPQTDMFAPQVDTDEGKLYVWDQVLSENLYVLCMSEMAAKITHRVLAGYRDVKTNTRPYLKNRDLVADIRNKKELPNVVARIKGKNNFWGNNKTDMNFDAIVGNPPYQDSSKNNHNDSIYHWFIDLAYCCGIAKYATLITPGRFLFNAGDTPSAWNKAFLDNENFKVVRYEKDSKSLFPAVVIKGGVAVTMCDTIAKPGPIGTFVDTEILYSILKKVIKKSNKRLSDITLSPSNYKFSTLAFDENTWLTKAVGKEKRLRTNIFAKAQAIFFDEKTSNEQLVEIIGLIDLRRVTKWIKKKYLSEDSNIDAYKVILPKANGTGALGEALSSPIIAEPYSIHTESFISMGAFNTKLQAEALYKYLCTKFCRALLGTLKVTQDNYPEAWANVPLQDFSQNTPIDWTKSVAEIDEQLFAYYGLTEAEQAFIKSTIKEMQ